MANFFLTSFPRSALVTFLLWNFLQAPSPAQTKPAYPESRSVKETLSSTANSSNSDDPSLPSLPAYIALLEGNPISTELYLWYLGRSMNRVFADFEKNSQVRNTSGFWNNKNGNRIPWLEAKQMALDSLLNDYTEFQILRLAGYIEDISWEALERHRTLENQKKQIAFKKNEVIAGPREWNPYGYFKYTLSRTRSLYMKDLTDTLKIDRHLLAELHRGSSLRTQPYLEVVDQITHIHMEKHYYYIVRNERDKQKIEINIPAFNNLSFSTYHNWVKLQPATDK